MAFRTPAKKAPPKKPAKPAQSQKGGSAQEVADRRARFIEAYLLNDGNITKAALAAGFSPKTAAQQGSRLFKSVEVQQAIQQRRDQVLTAAQEEVALTTKAVLKSLSQALFFDPRKLYAPDGSLRPIHELDEDTAMALTGLEVSEILGAAPKDEKLEPQAHGGALKREAAKKVVIGHTIKAKWLDKNSAREQAARMLGMFERDNRQLTNPLAALLADLQKNRSALPIVEQDAG